MIATNSSGQPLNANFEDALKDSLSRVSFALFKNGTQLQTIIDRATLQLGAGDSHDDYSDLTLGEVYTTLLEATLFDGAPDIGDELEVRVGVEIDSVFEWVTVAWVTVTYSQTWQDLTTIRAAGRVASRFNDSAELTTSSLSASELASALTTKTGVSVVLGDFTDTSQTVNVTEAMTCKQALQALAQRLGGFAAETTTGSVLVSPYTPEAVYVIPSEFVAEAPELSNELYSFSGLQVTSSDSVFTYGDGRLKIADATATASTSALTWSNLQSVASYTPGTIHSVIIDPRVTPFDWVQITVDETSLLVPARGISVAYDGGYFGDYSASGLSVTAEDTLQEGPISSAAREAKTAAEEAQAIAEATQQHFWYDSSGAHVTEVTRNQFLTTPTGFNLLENAYGILLRDGTANLAQLSQSNVAFYDGSGNDASNITALFGASGAQIGADSKPHITISQQGQTFYTDNEQKTTQISTNGAIGDPRGLDVPMGSLYALAGMSASNIAQATSDWYPSVAEIEAALEAGIPSYLIGYVSATNGSTSLAGDFELQIEALNQVIPLIVGKGSESAEVGSMRVNCTGSGYPVLEVELSANGRYNVGVSDIHVIFRLPEQAPVFIFGNQYYEELSDYGQYSVSLGLDTASAGAHSVALGRGLLATGKNQTALGKFNIEDVSNKYALIVGSGSSSLYRSNALTLDWSGNLLTSGDITDGSGNTLSSKLDSTTAAETYYPLIGGTLGSASQTETQVSFQTENYTSLGIKVYDNGTIYGHDMLIQSGAGMIIGAGEYPTNRYALGNIKDTENMYLGADGNVFVETNANTVGNRSTFQFGNNSFLLKTPLFDMSKANNGVSSTVYPSTVEIQDSGGRRMLRLEGIVNPTGSVGSAWYLRNFDTSGAQVAQKGIRLFLSKAGTLTYQFDDSANAVSALGLAASQVTITKNSSAVNGTGYTQCRRQGKIVIVNINAQLLASLAAGTQLFTGLPTPAQRTPTTIASNGGVARNVYVNTSGQLILESALNAAGWYSGTLVYFTA